MVVLNMFNLCVIDIFGISDYDLMFIQEKCDFEDEGEVEVDFGIDYIQYRVSIKRIIIY